jgi:hypothetical protein
MLGKEEFLYAKNQVKLGLFFFLLGSYETALNGCLKFKEPT